MLCLEIGNDNLQRRRPCSYCEILIAEIDRSQELKSELHGEMGQACYLPSRVSDAAPECSQRMRMPEFVIILLVTGHTL